MSEFFDQLKNFSERVFKQLHIKEKISPWRGGVFKGDGVFGDGSPTGAILHFTAGVSIERTLRWFMVKQGNARVSANCVIAKGWPAKWKELAEDLDLIRGLPTAIVQCVPPSFQSWHAKWANSTCYGVEIVNVGMLKKGFGREWFWWPDNWTRVWKRDNLWDPIFMYGKYWEPYTHEQILSTIEILRRVQEEYPTLNGYRVLGHEHVSKVKHDPGPHFPIHGVRAAVFENKNPLEYSWFQLFRRPGGYGEWWRDNMICTWWRNHSDIDGATIVSARIALMKRLDSWSSNRGVLFFGTLGKLLLQLLGYYVEDPYSPYLSVKDRISVGIFQRMMGLTVDSHPGPKTKAALVLRLKDRGIIG